MARFVILTAIMTLNIQKSLLNSLKSKRSYYAYVTMTSQQKWYWVLDYFNNIINFLCSLCSCKIHSFLKFAFLSIRRKSSKYSAKQHTFAQLCTKQMSYFFTKIFVHFWDIAMFVFWYFLVHLVHVRYWEKLLEWQMNVGVWLIATSLLTSCDHHHHRQLYYHHY